jgi:signal transduction histidine kinase/DNA-binding response OmpR family regulator
VAALLTTLCLAALEGGLLWRQHEASEAVARQELHVRKLAGDIVWLDEVLTMSVRLAAATGELRWEERYRAYEPRLDATLKEAMALSPEAYLLEGKAEVDMANQRLVEMENRMLALVQKGKCEDAAQILFGDYDKQKAIYAKGMARTQEILARSAEDQLLGQRRAMWLRVALGVGMLGVLVAPWGALVVSQGRRLQGLGAELRSRGQLEQQLVAARDQAQRASRARSDLVASMSHEIRTPMNSMLGMTELLLRTTLSLRQREWLLNIQRSGESLLTLLNDLLDFSKLEAGKLSIAQLPFDLRLTLEEVTDLLSVRSAEKGLDLIVRYDPQAPARVVGDPWRIRQVLSTFVSNAIQHTARGHVLIEVSCLGQAERGSRLRISVTDTGVGMGPEQLQALLDPQREGGAGLGLTLALKLAGLMRGQVGARSEPGEGSTFWFDLELPIDPHEATRLRPPGSLKGKTVLVVDDNPIDAQVVVEQLSQWGLRCTAVGSGREALRTLRQAYVDGRQYDVVVLDHAMPEMDGLEVARIIKRDAALRTVRLVMLTSTAQRGDAKMMEEAGFLGFLVKPARELQLVELIAAVLGTNGEPGHPIITRHLLQEQRALPTWQKLTRAAPARNHRVLLVEDHLVNRMVAMSQLDELRCVCDVAVDGAEAVEKTRLASYDLVLMDCQMPVMDGLEATAVIREREGAGPHLPIVALTATGTDEERARCLAVGMDDLLAKPVTMSALASVIERYCTSRLVSPPAGPRTLLEPEGPVLDLKQGLVVVGSKPALLERVIDELMADAPRRVAAVEVAWAQGDLRTVEREAHTLKGAASNVGAERFRRAAARLETAARQGEPGEVKTELAALRAELEELRRAVSAVDWSTVG